MQVPSWGGKIPEVGNGISPPVFSPGKSWREECTIHGVTKSNIEQLSMHNSKHVILATYIFKLLFHSTFLSNLCWTHTGLDFI